MESTDHPRPAPTPGEDARADQGSTMTATADRAKDAARDARGEVATVAYDARDQAATVVHEVQDGVRDVVDEARTVVHDEADRQTHTVAESVRRLAGDLRSMAERADHETAASDYIGRIGRSLDDVARRLDQGGVDGALDEIRTFARRHPGAFLAGSAASGFAVARVLRHASAPNGSSGPSRGTQPEARGELTDYGRSQLRSGQPDEGPDIDIRDDARQPSDTTTDVPEWVRP